MIEKFTGMILAGGKSSRMGEDKSFILFSGKPLIENLIDKLSPLFEDLIIITNQPHLYRKYGIKTQRDILPGRGSLGGMYTGLLFSKNMYNFIVACDMPFLNQDLVEYILKESNGYDVVVPERNGKFQPLCAVYSKNCIRPIETKLSRNNLKITDFFQYVQVKTITEKEIGKLDPQQLCFVNINTPQDYQRFGGDLTNY